MATEPARLLEQLRDAIGDTWAGEAPVGADEARTILDAVRAVLTTDATEPTPERAERAPLRASTEDWCETSPADGHAWTYTIHAGPLRIETRTCMLCRYLSVQPVAERLAAAEQALAENARLRQQRDEARRELADAKNETYRACAEEIAGVLDVEIPAELPPDGEGWDWLIRQLRGVLGEAEDWTTERDVTRDSLGAVEQWAQSVLSERLIDPIADWAAEHGEDDPNMEDPLGLRLGAIYGVLHTAEKERHEARSQRHAAEERYRQLAGEVGAYADALDAAPTIVLNGQQSEVALARRRIAKELRALAATAPTDTPTAPPVDEPPPARVEAGAEAADLLEDEDGAPFPEEVQEAHRYAVIELRADLVRVTQERDDAQAALRSEQLTSRSMHDGYRTSTAERDALQATLDRTNKDALSTILDALGLTLDEDDDTIEMAVAEIRGLKIAYREMKAAQATLDDLRARAGALVNEWRHSIEYLSPIARAAYGTCIDQLREVLDSVPTQNDTAAPRGYSSGDAGPFVSHDPAMRNGEATLNHTRLSIDALAGYVWIGEDVNSAYDITRADVLVACWWIGTFGPKKWRKRWGAWAEAVHSELWHSKYDVAYPPTQTDRSEPA